MLSLLLQLAQESGAAETFDPGIGFWLHYYIFVWSSGIASTIYALLLLWMLYECVTKDPERNLWFWIIILVQPIGAPLYFFVRFLPNRRPSSSSPISFFQNRKELQRLEVATIQIGNPYHFIQYGDMLLSMKKYKDALSAFSSALQKEPTNIQALWGAAQCQLELGQLTEARPHLEAVLKQDPAYRFGDVSLAYGRLLQELKDNDSALTHLEKHINRWRQPEACYRLAELKAERGEKGEAIALLKHTLVDFQASPASFSHKHGVWKRKTKSLLSKLSA